MSNLFSALNGLRGELEQTITAQINRSLTPAQRRDAVLDLANKLGVDLTPEPSAVKDGDTVQTDQGAARAVVLTPADRETLRKLGRAL